MAHPGVVGKTFATFAIRNFLKSKERHMASVAASVVGAQLLDDGRTTHSTFQVPIPLDYDSTCKIPIGFTPAHDFRRKGLIILDKKVTPNR